MDPVTSISLACNAVQLVETSIKIVREAHELYTGAREASIKVQDMNNVTADLQDVTERLSYQLRRPTVKRGYSLISDEPDEKSYPMGSLSAQLQDDFALRELCKHCAATAEELAHTLKGYKVGKKGARTRDRLPESVQVAIRTYFKKGELDELNDRLRNYRDQLMLRLLIYTREEGELSRLEQLEKLRDISHDTREIISETSQTRRFIQSTTEIQTQVLNNIISSAVDRILREVQIPRPHRDRAALVRSLEASDSEDLDHKNGAMLAEDESYNDKILDAIKARKLSEVRAIVRRKPGIVFELIGDNGGTALHHACQSCDYDIALHLIRNGAKLNADDDQGRVPLHYAAIADHGAMVRTLIEKGAEIGIQDYSGAVPAAYARKGSEVEWIFKWGTEHDALDDQRTTSLHRFTESDDIHAVRSILDQKGASPDMCSHESVTALMVAAEKGRLQIAKLLISRGASIDSKDDHNDTAMIRAARYNQVAIVRELLDHKADVEIYNNMDFTAINEAAAHGHTEVAQLLLSHGADGQHMSSHTGHRPLQHAAQQGHFGVVQACLDSGVPVDSISYWGWTPLHEASKHNFIDIVELCLQRGADPNIQTVGDKMFATPLHEAAEHNRVEILQLLLANPRTNTGLQDSDGKTALLRAMCRGHDKAATALIKAGAPANAMANNGQHALLIAAARGNVDCVTQLIAAGADVNLKHASGSTALIEAAARGITPVVRILIRAGADVELRNHSGYTALTQACRVGSVDTVRLLLEGFVDPDMGIITSPADVEHRGKDGWSPLMEASHWGKESCVRLLLERGARLDRTNDAGQTAIDLAVESNRVAVADMLIKEVERRAAKR